MHTNRLESRPDEPIQFRVFATDYSAVKQYADSRKQSLAAAVREIVLNHVARETGANVDPSLYESSTASTKAQVAAELGMTPGQLQAFATRFVVEAHRSGTLKLPPLLHQSSGTPPTNVRITRPRRRRAK